MKVIITARVKNAALVETRLALGYKTMKDMERVTGLGCTMICAAENFLYYPKRKDTIKKWEIAYRSNIEHLFPKIFKTAVDRKLGRPMRFTKELLNLPGPDAPIAYLESWDEKEGHPEDHVLDALNTLTEREAKVLKLRFGFTEDGEMTLRQIGDRFKVTQERIRQTEAKALRKMKHPSRCRELRRPQR